VPVFRFHHEWHLPAPFERTYAALADVERYDRWWPQVRSLERIDDVSGRVTIRSVLPYTLHLVLTREAEDEGSGLLRVGVAGDLDGWCQWQVRGDGDDTVAVFDQEAVVTPALLARTASLTAPLLRANHAWMMRAGQVGLARHLGRE
jgi:uncharacterized protein YndB with AHSA1/START domain